jgi:pimeloyl-ACP methyl ester carboxylesterase
MATRRIVTTRFGQMHLREAGAGGTPLVLLHMSPRSSRMYQRLQEQLTRRTLAFDRLGYGFSDAPPRDLSLEEHTQALVEALDAAGIEGPFDVLGMHTGSLEAIELAHQIPQRLRHVALVGAPIFSATERVAALQHFGSMRVAPAEDGSHLVAAWRARLEFRSPPYDLEDVHRRLVDYLLAPFPGQAYQGVFRYDHEARLAALARPLIVFAPHDDLIEKTARARSLLPAGSVYVDLPELDIDLFHRQPERMADLVRQHMGG